MENIKKAMRHIDISDEGSNHRHAIPFSEFLEVVLKNPTGTILSLIHI